MGGGGVTEESISDLQALRDAAGPELANDEAASPLCNLSALLISRLKFYHLLAHTRS